MSIRQRLRNWYNNFVSEEPELREAKVYLFKAETDHACHNCGKEIKEGTAIIYIAGSEYHTCMSCGGK